MTSRKKLVFAGFVLLASFGRAHADDDRVVWRDTEGQIVHDSWGTCVRANWITNGDACAPAQPQAIIWKPQPHTIIAQEDRTVYFGFNRADLTEDAKARLDTLAEKLKSASDVQGAQVAGYADRIGTTSYNELLSKKRAENVRDYLSAHDVVNTSVTKTRWFGKSEPSADCSNKLPRTQLIACLRPDRKVQVDITYKSQTQEPSQ